VLSDNLTCSFNMTDGGASDAGGMLSTDAGSMGAPDAGIDDGGTPDSGSLVSADAGADAGSQMSSDAGHPDVLRFLSAPQATGQCGLPYPGWGSETPRLSQEGDYQFSLRGPIPDGMTIDSVTAAIAWRPTNTQGGLHTVTLVASSAAGEATTEITLDVTCAPRSLLVGCGCGQTGAPSLLIWSSVLSCLWPRVRPRRRHS